MTLEQFFPLTEEEREKLKKKICPRCGAKGKQVEHKHFYCSKCGNKVLFVYNKLM